jgi:hypothetical protein
MEPPEFFWVLKSVQLLFSVQYHSVFVLFRRNEVKEVPGACVPPVLPLLVRFPSMQQPEPLLPSVHVQPYTLPSLHAMAAALEISHGNVL